MRYLTLLQENVRDGAVYYAYMVDNVHELVAKDKAGVTLSNDEKEVVDAFIVLLGTFIDFHTAAIMAVLSTFATLNDILMNG